MKLHSIPRGTKVLVAKASVSEGTPKYIDYITKEDKTYFAEEFNKVNPGYHMYSKHTINGEQRSIPSELYANIKKDGWMMLVELSKVNLYCNMS